MLEPIAPVKKKRRKPRSDRTHIVYQITSSDARSYIGITAKTKSTIEKSIALRLQKHVSRAINESHDWALCNAIRELGREAFTIKALHVVLTKKLAHDLERYLIDLEKPVLNSDTREWAKYKYVPLHVKRILEPVVDNALPT